MFTIKVLKLNMAHLNSIFPNKISSASASVILKEKQLKPCKGQGKRADSSGEREAVNASPLENCNIWTLYPDPPYLNLIYSYHYY